MSVNLIFTAPNMIVILIKFFVNFTNEFSLANICNVCVMWRKIRRSCFLDMESRKCKRQTHSSFIGFCLPFTENRLNTLIYHINLAFQSSSWNIATHPLEIEGIRYSFYRTLKELLITSFIVVGFYRL